MKLTISMFQNLFILSIYWIPAQFRDDIHVAQPEYCHSRESGNLEYIMDPELSQG